MAVDPARQDQLAPRINVLASRPEAAAQSHDPAAPDCHIGAKHIAGGGHSSVADHEVMEWRWHGKGSGAGNDASLSIS
jgi:hypothetical protein